MKNNLTNAAGRRKFLSIVLFSAGATLVLVAGLWAFQNYIREFNAEQASTAILEQIYAAETGDTASVMQADAAIAGNAAQYPVVGRIVLDKLAMELPVMETSTTKNLAVGPCIYSGTLPADGDLMVLSGHNYKKQFGPIDRLVPGDTVTFVPLDGATVIYTVYETGTIPADGVEQAESAGEGKCLNLYTCDSTGSERILVKCQNGKTV